MPCPRIDSERMSSFCMLKQVSTIDRKTGNFKIVTVSAVWLDVKTTANGERELKIVTSRRVLERSLITRKFSTLLVITDRTIARKGEIVERRKHILICEQRRMDNLTMLKNPSLLTIQIIAVWGCIQISLMKITIPQRMLLGGVKHHCISIYSIIWSKNTEETKKNVLIIIFIVGPEALGKSEPKEHRNTAAHKSIWLIIEKPNSVTRPRK